MRIAVLNGPNLNLLGRREPSVYGTATLADIEAESRAAARDLGATITWFQSNHEGAIIDAVHALPGQADAAIVNAAGLSHTSIALRDALLGVAVPFVEVHISNVHAREPFRHRSLLADIAVGSVTGLGPIGYRLALEGLVARLREH